MDEAEIRTEARLQALEYLVCNLYARIFAQAPDPEVLAQERADAVRAYAAKFTIPEVEPALSDMASAELADALDRLLQMIDEMVTARTARE